MASALRKPPPRWSRTAFSHPPTTGSARAWGAAAPKAHWSPASGAYHNLQEYCGDVINFKTYSKSYKLKARIENTEENKAVFLNVHEAVIDRATWEKVQRLKSGIRRKRPAVSQGRSIFSGLLKCPECSANLNFHFNQGNHDIKFFSCANHNSGLRKCSTTHYIWLEFLEQVV